jgi:thiol-disulfide isomerase/thioredoxin
MKKIFLPLLIASIGSVNAVSQSGRKIRPVPTAPIQPSLTPEPEIPATVPGEMRSLPESIRDRRIKALDDSNFRLADFDGKVVVINIWASWCGPCRREVPEYEKVRQEFQGREVEFIGLTTEDPHTASGRVKKFVRDINFGFRLGWADAEMARTLMSGRRAIPQTLVFDAEWRIISNWSGYSPGKSGSRLRQMIQDALTSTGQE